MTDLKDNTYRNEIKPWPYGLASSYKTKKPQVELVSSLALGGQTDLHDSLLARAGREKKRKNQDYYWLIIG